MIIESSWLSTSQSSDISFCLQRTPILPPRPPCGLEQPACDSEDKEVFSVFEVFCPNKVIWNGWPWCLARVFWGFLGWNRILEFQRLGFWEGSRNVSEFASDQETSVLKRGRVTKRKVLSKCQLFQGWTAVFAGASWRVPPMEVENHI